MGAKTGNQTRSVPALQRRAAIQPSSINEEQRSVDLVWTTGERVLRSDFWEGDFFEELSLDPKHVRMGRLNSGRAPLLANHSSRSLEDVIGVIESAGIGTARVRFAKDDPQADAAWNKVRQGVLPNISVGYRTYKFEKVEGGKDTTPVFRATDWEPYEVSIVPMGADSAAHIRSADTETKPCVFVTQEESRIMTEEEKRALAEADAKAKVDQERREAEIRDQAVKAERERCSGIEHAVRVARLDATLAATLIAAGASVDAARTKVLEALEKRSASDDIQPVKRVEVTDDRRDKWARGAGAWLIEKSGVRRLFEDAEKKGVIGFKNTEFDGGEFRGAQFGDLARLFLESRGVPIKKMDRLSLFQQAWNYRSGYAATSDFAVLFESILYKTMLAAYETQPDVWSQFCGTKEVQDFRPSNFFRTGSFGVLPPLNENGEFQNTPIPDGEKSSVSVGTYGDIIAISRQTVINDDMGALTDLARKRGEDAHRTIEAKVFELLLKNTGLGPTQTDGQPFFHAANRANVNASATANTAVGWDADAQVMGLQEDPSGNHKLNLTPTVLLLPRAKRMEAEVLNGSTVKVGGTNGEPNPAAGMARRIVSTTELSGTRRYWFADPARNPAILVAFLAGQGSAPQLFSEDGFRVDGTEMKTRLDFGVAFFDPRCAVTNAGA